MLKINYISKVLERSVLNIDWFKYYLQYIVMKITSFVGVKAAFLELRSSLVKSKRTELQYRVHKAKVFKQNSVTLL